MFLTVMKVLAYDCLTRFLPSWKGGKGGTRNGLHTLFTTAPAGSIRWIRQSQARAGRDSKSIKSKNT